MRRTVLCLIVFWLAACDHLVLEPPSDGSLRLDANPDGDIPWSDADSHVPEADVDEVGPTCHLSAPPRVIREAEGDEPLRLTHLDVIPDGHLMLSMVIGAPTEERSVIAFLDGRSLGLTRESLLEGTSIIATHHRFTGELVALGDDGHRVSFVRLTIGADWGVTQVAERRLCTGCRASASEPIDGLSPTAVSAMDPERGQVQSYIVPLEQDDSARPSGPLSGTNPVLVNGTFGPILLFLREGRLYGVQIHWDGAISGDPFVIDAGPLLPEVAAGASNFDTIRVALLTDVSRPRLRLIALDSTGRTVGVSEGEGPSPFGLPLTVDVGDHAVITTWQDRSDHGTTEVMVMASDLEGRELLAANPIGPGCDTDEAASGKVVSTFTDLGYVLVWVGCDEAARPRLMGAILICEM
jgi:hypothetical protein